MTPHVCAALMEQALIIIPSCSAMAAMLQCTSIAMVYWKSQMAIISVTDVEGYKLLWTTKNKQLILMRPVLEKPLSAAYALTIMAA
jgi:hypothetical protein